MNRRTLFRLAGATAVASIVAACGGAVTTKPDIVSIAASNDQFSTLVAAVTAAALVDSLTGPGPCPGFAPADSACSQLPAGTVENLLKPENKDQLVKILTYHVVPGNITSDQLVGKTQDVATVQGQTVRVDGRNGVRVNGVTVSQADIQGSNGVIHRIARVVLPD